MTKIFRARAPLRLGLAGGGSDVSPYCDTYGGQILNATIDLYAHCTIVEHSEPCVTFRALDKEVEETHFAESELGVGEGLMLHKAVYNRVVREFHGGEPLSCSVSTHCDAPPGSGLGSSSTLVVAMLQAYCELLRLPLGEYDLARLAYDIERTELGHKGGRQDQYAAAFGGFNFMEFGDKERVIVNPLRIKEWIVNEFESSLVLYYTSVSRFSSNIIQNQIDNTRNGNQCVVEATHQIKADARCFKDSLLQGNLGHIAAILQRSWECKKRLSPAISNSLIDHVFGVATKAGALAGKVSGAGGGGHIMFLVDPVRKIDVARALQAAPGRIVPFRFTNRGADSWLGQFWSTHELHDAMPKAAA